MQKKGVVIKYKAKDAPTVEIVYMGARSDSEYNEVEAYTMGYDGAYASTSMRWAYKHNVFPALPCNHNVFR